MKLNLDSEYKFRVLWYFLSFIFGVVLYFGLFREPNLIMCLVLSGVLLTAALLRKAVWIKLALFFVLGISVATFRTHLIHTEFMERAQWKREISGLVEESFSSHEGQMLVLTEVRIPKSRFVPKRIRVFFDRTTPCFNKGDYLSFVGNLYPPLPHQKMRFFYQGISAQGKILDMISHVPSSPTFLTKLRQNIMNKLRMTMSPMQTQIAIPLIVGEQGVVSSDVYELYRKAGIAHVLSVSGFHMVLLAGFVFFLIRGLLALFPYLALRLSTKKIAAVVSLFVTGFYLFVSGAQVPAIRAFMMIAVVFFGVLTDRRTVSLYTLLLVAFVVLWFRPEWVMSISFQLSFVAVMVLVGVFEDVCKYLPKGLFCRVVITAVIANIFVTLALAPFIIYHFNQLNPYGIVGNLLTSLLFSGLVMPLLFLGTLLMPFGYETIPLKGAGIVLDQITKIAEMIASWPGAEIIVASFSGWGLGLIVMGLAVLCVLKRPLRMVGLALIVLGFGIGYWINAVPDMIVLNKTTLLVKGQDGLFRVRGKQKEWLTAQILRKYGQKTGEQLSQSFISAGKYKISVGAAKCQEADLTILFKENKMCDKQNVLIPRAHTIYEIYLGENILIKNKDSENSNRPWNMGGKKDKRL